MKPYLELLLRSLRSRPLGYMSLAFAVLVINKLGFDASGGEEHYLAFARQFADPRWIPGSFTLTEFAGSRVVFQWIMGFFVRHFSFEAVVFGARLVNFALLSIPTGLFFHRLGWSLPMTFVAFQVFVLSEQNLVGGEWIFKTFEPKSVAYIFVFFALFHLLRSQHCWMALHLALATYFHVLVGGWAVVIVGLWLLSRKEVRKALAFGGLYVLLAAPFALYLFRGYFGSELPSTEVNLDWVYCYYRLPNHLGIWRDTDYFLQGHARDSVITLLLFMAGWWWHRFLPASLQMLNRLMLIIFAINLAYIGVAAMDHFVFDNSGGFGLKYYPFRTNSLGMFLALLIVLHTVARWLESFAFRQWIYWGAFTAVVMLDVVQGVNNVKRSVEYFAADPDYRQMCAWIVEHTQRTSVFLLLAPYYTSPDYYSFNRRAERENFAVPKFVAAERGKLLEWYKRLVEYNRVRSKLDHLEKVEKRYGVNYLLLASETETDFLDPVHRVGIYRLYRIRSEKIRASDK